MTINSEVRAAGPFEGNDVATSFPFEFKVFADSEVLVVRELDGVELVMDLGTDYTVALNADQDSAPGGSVDLPAPLPVGYTLSMTSALAPLQPVDLTNQGGFYPRVINSALDRLTILIQQLRERLGRSLTFPISDGGVGSSDLPGRVARRGSVLAFHETTGAPVVGPSVAAVGTVGGNVAAINTVAASITDVNTVAGNINDVTNFAAVYYGPSATDPLTRRDGSPLQDGDLYFNTFEGGMRVYNRGAEAWRALPLTAQSSVVTYSGTGVQTDFPLPYNPLTENNVHVYVSGVYQQKATYTVVGSVLGFVEPPPAGVDNIEAILVSVAEAPARVGGVFNVLDYIVTPIDGTTSNQAGIEDAVTAAFSAGASLFWPAGIYVSDANIPQLHSVRHTGDGVLKRGADLFPVQARAGQSITLYCAASGGAAGNDGLSATHPVSTVQGALNVLTNYGPALAGTWVVRLAAGVYAGGVTYPDGVGSETRVQIVGPSVGASPAAPTAILDGGGVSSFGMTVNDSAKLLLRDLKFQNFLDFGVNTQDFCDVYYLNVHCENIAGGRGIGIQNQQARVRVMGGVFTNCSNYGMQFISGCTVSVGSLTNDLAGGAQVVNCGVGGALAQESSTGHFDYVTVDGAPYGLDLVVSSRMNSTACAFRNISVTGVRARLGSTWLDNNGTCTWLNTPNRVRFHAHSNDTNRMAAAVSQIRSIFDGQTETLTGTTAETTMKSYANVLPADSFDWSGRSLRVVITGKFAGASSTKTLRVKVGGAIAHGLVSVVSSTGFFRYEGVLTATGAATQAYHAFMLDTSATVVRGDSGTRNINMVTGAAFGMLITGELGSAAETITVHSVEVWETA